MFLNDIYKNKKTVLSFEVFPPKENYDLSSLYDTVKDLKKLSPDFVSVTYGAGGGTREKTVDIASYIKNDLGIESVAHFTCVNSSKEDILNVLNLLSKNNIKNILALRGDPPAGQSRFTKTIGGFDYASELVDFIRNHDSWSVAVAGYPEGHPDSGTLELDLDYLKQKVDSGADLIITQLFFNNDFFYRFRDKAYKAGIRIPIVPGIFPIINFKSIKRMTGLIKATLPALLYEKLEKYSDSTSETEKIGIEYAISQADSLLKNEVSGLHFYTMNKSRHIEEILKNIKF